MTGVQTCALPIFGRAARLRSLKDDSLREVIRAGSLSLLIRRKGCADGGLGYRGTGIRTSV